jgi:transposase
MYIDDQTYSRNEKTYRRTLLRFGKRVNGKIVMKTVANLSHCSDEEIEALKIAMQMKDDIASLRKIASGEYEYGRSIGAVSALYQASEKLGIRKSLGNTQEGNLCLWMIFARLIDQGSRLSAVRLAQTHAACEILGMKSFNEDDLYDSLDWLYKNRDKIEKKMFNCNADKRKSNLFLYDLSSSYLEGEKNELAMFGYNRDGKKGKMQINYGLLTDEDGDPVSIQAYPGNTKDNKTVGSQIEKLKTSFGCEHITFVGDKGTIKTDQIGELNDAGFNYITSITKDQIRTLLNNGDIQMEFFDVNLCEIVNSKEKVRYILRKNPERARKIQENRQSKIEKLNQKIEEANKYLSNHSRAKTSTQLNNLLKYAEKLKIEEFIKIESDEKTGHITLELNNEKIKKDGELDGCYVIKTDLPKDVASSQIVHDRYKDLSLVERAFRTCKTGYLEIRPVFLRDADRTSAHLLVTMMAYKIERYLEKSWKELDLTVQEGIGKLSAITSLILTIGDTKVVRVGKPDPACRSLLKKIEASLPNALPYMEIEVNTRKKLPEERKI